jgi:hypothetical protein
MKRKRAVITVELVDESVGTKNDSIAEDLLNWFREDSVPAPWVKDVKIVVVQEY